MPKGDLNNSRKGKGRRRSTPNESNNEQMGQSRNYRSRSVENTKEQNKNSNSTQITEPAEKVRKKSNRQKSGNKVLKPTNAVCQMEQSFNQDNSLQELDYEDDLPIDGIAVSVSQREDQEFNTDGEDNVDSDNESLIAINEQTAVSQNEEDDREVVFKSSQSNFDELKSNPAFQDYVQKLVSEQLKGECDKQKQKTPDKRKVCRKGKDNDIIKSPSDTTLYAPALRRISGNGQQRINIAPQPSFPFSVDNISKFIEEIRVRQDDVREEMEQSQDLSIEPRSR